MPPELLQCGIQDSAARVWHTWVVIEIVQSWGARFSSQFVVSLASSWFESTEMWLSKFALQASVVSLTWELGCHANFQGLCTDYLNQKPWSVAETASNLRDNRLTPDSNGCSWSSDYPMPAVILFLLLCWTCIGWYFDFFFFFFKWGTAAMSSPELFFGAVDCRMLTWGWRATVTRSDSVYSLSSVPCWFRLQPW